MFQGCTKAWKNTENYCKNMSEVKSGLVLLGSALETLGDAQGVFLREFGNFESRGVE